MASNGNEPVDSAAVSAEADVLYEKGVAAIKSGAMEEAIELLAKALELKTTAHGEEAVECAPAYYKYGCALFYKAQDENTVFGKQAQAQADAKDEAARKASGSGAADEGEACDDADDAPEGDAAKDGDAEAEEEEEEDDMELAWKLIENARLIYEEAEDHPIELANCYETLGEINTEHSNFKEALEDLERCLAILETELDDDDRRIAGVLCSMSVAHQMLDEYEKALKGCTRAIGVCRARVKRLKSSDEAAVGSRQGVPRARRDVAGGPARGGQGGTRPDRGGARRSHRAREEELRGLVSEDNNTREQIKKAFAAIGGAAVGAGSSADGAAGAEESGGFAAPKLTTGATAPVNLGVVGKSAGAARVSAAPVVRRIGVQTTRQPRARRRGRIEGTQARQPRARRRGARPRRLVRRGGRRRLRGDERCVRTRARERFGRARGEEGEGGSGWFRGGPTQAPGTRPPRRKTRQTDASSSERAASRRARVVGNSSDVSTRDTTNVWLRHCARARARVRLASRSRVFLPVASARRSSSEKRLSPSLFPGVERRVPCPESVEIPDEVRSRFVRPRPHESIDPGEERDGARRLPRHAVRPLQRPVFPPRLRLVREPPRSKPKLQSTTRGRRVRLGAVGSRRRTPRSPTRRRAPRETSVGDAFEGARSRGPSRGVPPVDARPHDHHLFPLGDARANIRREGIYVDGLGFRVLLVRGPRRHREHGDRDATDDDLGDVVRRGGRVRGRAGGGAEGRDGVHATERTQSSRSRSGLGVVGVARVGARVVFGSIPRGDGEPDSARGGTGANRWRRRGRRRCRPRRACGGSRTRPGRRRARYRRRARRRPRRCARGARSRPRGARAWGDPEGRSFASARNQSASCEAKVSARRERRRSPGLGGDAEHASPPTSLDAAASARKVASTSARIVARDPESAVSGKARQPAFPELCHRLTCRLDEIAKRSATTFQTSPGTSEDTSSRARRRSRPSTLRERRASRVERTAADVSPPRPNLRDRCRDFERRPGQMPTVAPVKWPEGGAVTPEWVHRLASSLDANTRSGEPPKNLQVRRGARARRPHLVHPNDDDDG